MISRSPCSPAAASASMSPSIAALNGWVVAHSGCSGASAWTRSSAKASWVYIGCSTQSVPSLSKVAMRSASGTKSGLASSVTASTNATIAALASPSFQEGSGSSCAWAAPATSATATSPESNAEIDRIIFVPSTWRQSVPQQKRGAPVRDAPKSVNAQRVPEAPCSIMPAASPMVKLPGFCRGGNSSNVARNCPMYSAAGRSTKARSRYQS